MNVITFPTSGLQILLHGVISLPDATSYDKKISEYDQEIPQTHCRPTNGTVRKSGTTLTATRHQKDDTSKATTCSSLFLVKITGKLERTQSKANIKTKTNTEPP